MRVLAFNIAHDSSVCSINNGTIEFFCKEERLSRFKRDMHPFRALELYKSKNFGNIDHILYHTPTNSKNEFEIVYRHYIRKNFNKELENFSNLKHHLCHASLAFYNSGFQECLTFVIDRNGSLFFINNDPAAAEAESVYYCSYPDNLKPIYKSFSSKPEFSFNIKKLKNEIQHAYIGTNIDVHDSLGIVKVYEAATTLINQHPLENGKTMGLSAYGGDHIIEPLFVNNSPITNHFSIINTQHMKNVICFRNHEDKISNLVTTENYHFYADKAKQVQLETQQASLDLIKKYVDLTGIKNVCVVGGYGLNVVANNYYIENMPGVDFYFEPLADDTGVSIGAAMLKYRTESKDSEIRPIKDIFYHYYNFNESIIGGTSSTVSELVDILISQKSLGIFNGAPEAGPRALGNRSILFDPRNQNSKDIVNKIKKREWYRPFAGIILKDKLEEFFKSNNIGEYPFMTVSLHAKQLAKETVPGIIHIDGTCRIQTVSEGFIFDLLTEFYNKTGCPMLLNTSLNLAGEPLAQTKNDAINILKNSELDYVYFVEDDKLIENREI